MYRNPFSLALSSLSHSYIIVGLVCVVWNGREAKKGGKMNEENHPRSWPEAKSQPEKGRARERERELWPAAQYQLSHT